MKTSVLSRCAFAILGSLCLLGSGQAASKPNFVWIVSEDNAWRWMRLFDPHGAATPNLERMAQEGLVFEHAFCNGPVCSVARTTLATGVYAPRIGAQFHRRYKYAVLPSNWHLFPYYLRQAGYYTANRRKKDYNVVEGQGVWDESSKRASWRRRPTPDTPFFYMFSFGVSHESSLHFQKMNPSTLHTDPAKVSLAPYHPDTPLFRYSYARYLDQMKKVDQTVGQVLEDLRKDGLLEDTFVFYFGDNGGVLPRSKGYLYEVGLHVPLIVRIPKHWAHLVRIPRGTRVRGFVSFLDFGPTVLHLAGIPVPSYMDGRPFLGPDLSLDQINRRDETFGYADRFDEKYDMVRSLRKGRFKYIRNYQAYYPDALQNNYRYRMLAYRQWRELYREGKLNPVQRQFFEPKPVEALYDLQTDPYEVHNLAGDPRYAQVLKQLRQRLEQWEKDLPDLSFYPEAYLVQHAMDNPVRFGREHQAEIRQLIDVANWSLLPFPQAESKLRRALQSSNPWIRYWALIDCACFGQKARSLIPLAKKCLHDPEPLVRIRAAEFLAVVHAADPRPALYQIVNTSKDPVTIAMTLNTIVFLRDHLGYSIDPNQLHPQVENDGVQRRMEYLAQENPYHPNTSRSEERKG